MHPSRFLTRCGLVRRKECLVLTLRGWLCLGLGTVLTAATLGWGLHPFLAVTDPVPARHLVVEGWLPDYALAGALREFQAGPYERLFTIGGPLDHGRLDVQQRTYAELAATYLITLGLASNSVLAVPDQHRQRGRTYGAALALRDHLRQRDESPEALNVITLGPHARRTRLLFEEAFGKPVQIGVISIPCQSYDPGRWWASSEGAKDVLGELLGYCFAK